jgi:DNA-binding beta-propeller fold protein YncE
MVLDEAGNVFAVDGNTIVKFTPDGNKSTFASELGFGNPFELTFDENGNLFVAVADSEDSILRFTPDGAKSTFATGLSPTAMAFDGAGNLFVAGYRDHSIFKFSPDGKKSTFATGIGHAAFLTFDHKGNLFVADWERDSIFKFTPNGVRSAFASKVTPEAMTFDKAGNLFVADRHSISKFAPNGTKTAFAAGIPWLAGLVFDTAGNLFVADSATDSIFKFTGDGAKSTFAAPPPSPYSAEELESASPDGKFAFRISYGEDLRTIDLIDAKSEKVVFRIAETDESQTYWSVLWAPDSKRFALMTRLAHPIQGVSVYAKSGDTFHEVELPALPEANIPDRLKRGKHFPHVASLNWQSAVAWKKDGSLVVDIDTTIDGDGSSLSATRTVVLGFDRSGKARILKSTIKFKTEESDPVLKAEKLETAGRTAQDKGDINGAIAAYSRAIKLDPGDVSAYYHRGCANFMKRDWPTALSDFQHHCDLRKEEEYQVFPARFYIWLIRARLGDREAADKELAPYMEGHPVEWSSGWDAKIGNFVLGRISEDDFIVSLSDNPGTAWFYAGMKRLLNNDRASAAEDFRKSMATGDKTAEEYQMAVAKLKALSK